MQDRTPERLGPYRLLRRIGEGGMGVVYLAVDDAGRSVAVKVLHPAMAAEGNARQRLAREVQTMRLVRSKYVAEVVDADLDGAQPYIVTQYVPGMPLEDVVSAGGPMAGPALARLACGLTQALAAVHAAGVVHRDLKPGNVMISDGDPVVIDFGIAQLPETTRLTMTGMFMGTPGYLAPEVIEGNGSGPASDVHSLGATLVYAATGRPPYGTGAYEAIFYRIMHGQPDLDGLPVPLVPLIAAALSRDPDRRPSAAVLAAQVSALEPAELLPSPPMRGGAAAWPGGPGCPDRTIMDGADWPIPRDNTRPIPADGPADVLDLLPPVSLAAHSAQGPLLPAAQDAVAGIASPGQLGPGAAVPGGTGTDEPQRAGPGLPGGIPVGPVSAWSPLIFATVAMAVAISLIAPIAGTAIALGIFVALRAAGTTGRQIARRRSGDGRRPSDLVVAAALFPLALLRSALTLLLAAPVALLGFCVVAAITIIVVPQHPLPQAAAFGAGTMVAIVGLGPWSSGFRTVLADMLSSVASTRSRLGVTYFGILALAAWAGLQARSTWPNPAFWPVTSVHAQIVHLPTVRSVLTDIRLSLLRLARHFGL